MASAMPRAASSCSTRLAARRPGRAHHRPHVGAARGCFARRRRRSVELRADRDRYRRRADRQPERRRGRDGAARSRLLRQLRSPRGRGSRAFSQAARATVVVGDIPPLAFAAAARAGVPSVAVGNFTWDWIYSGYDAFEQRRRGVISDDPRRLRDSHPRAAAAAAWRIRTDGGGDHRHPVHRAAIDARPGGDAAHAWASPAIGRSCSPSFSAADLDLPYSAIADAEHLTVLAPEREPPACLHLSGSRGRGRRRGQQARLRHRLGVRRQRHGRCSTPRADASSSTTCSSPRCRACCAAAISRSEDLPRRPVGRRGPRAAGAAAAAERARVDGASIAADAIWTRRLGDVAIRDRQSPDHRITIVLVYS